jgi:hypothetical protein
MSDKKYEIRRRLCENGRGEKRVRALKDFADVKKGDLGGYIQSEDNLSQEGNCWIYDNAKVYGNAKVYDNALVYDSAKVYGNARVCEKAKVYGDIHIYDRDYIYDDVEEYSKGFIEQLTYGETDISGLTALPSATVAEVKSGCDCGAKFTNEPHFNWCSNYLKIEVTNITEEISFITDSDITADKDNILKWLLVKEYNN